MKKILLLLFVIFLNLYIVTSTSPPEPIIDYSATQLDSDSWSFNFRNKLEFLDQTITLLDVQEDGTVVVQIGGIPRKIPPQKIGKTYLHQGESSGSFIDIKNEETNFHPDQSKRTAVLMISYGEYIADTIEAPKKDERIYTIKEYQEICFSNGKDICYSATVKIEGKVKEREMCDPPALEGIVFHCDIEGKLIIENNGVSSEFEKISPTILKNVKIGKEYIFTLRYNKIVDAKLLDDEKIIIPPPKEKKPIVDPPKEKSECNGCLDDNNNCVPINYRIGTKYCSIGKELMSQRGNGAYCDNNLECGSNFCNNNQCIEKGFITKLIIWFGNLFG